MTDMLQKGFTLSPQQRCLWRQNHGDARTAQGIVAIDGPLDPILLKAALHTIVERHEILRTNFVAARPSDLPLQVITEEASVDWQIVDSSHTNDPDGQIRNLAAEERNTIFDLSAGPPLRARLVRVADQRHVLLLTLPALCADFATLSNITKLLHNLYDGRGHFDTASETIIQYKDFAQWRDNVLGSPEAQQARSFFEPAMAAAAAGSRLNDSTAESREFSGIALPSQTIAPAVTEGLRILRSKSDLSTAAIFLACLQIGLWRVFSRRHFVVWDAFDGRDAESLLDSMGLFSFYLPLACKIDDGITLERVVRNAEDSQHSVREWSPFFNPEEVYPSMHSPTGGFSVGLDCRQFERYPDADTAFSLIVASTCNERTDLRLVCDLRGESIVTTLYFEPSTLSADAAGRVASAFVHCLENVAADPTRTVKSLWSSPIEAQTGSTPDSAAGSVIHRLFREQVQRTPDRVAGVYESEYVTYDELDRRADWLAAKLQMAGATVDGLVGLSMERSIELLVGVFGILKVGAAYSPLDPAWPADHLTQAIRALNLAICVTGGSVARPQVSPWTVVHPPVQADLDASDCVKDSSTGSCRAYVISTSGSTGGPKGVAIEHRSAVNLVSALYRAIYCHFPSALRLSLNAPLSFDASVKHLLQLLQGHTLVIVPERLRLDGPGMLAFVAAQQLDAFDCTPSQLKVLLNAGLDAPTNSCSGVLRFVLVGGEPIDSRTWSRLAEISSMAFYNLYGPTECTVDTTVAKVTALAEPNIGRQLSNIDVYVLDDGMEPVGPGVAGHIHISGAGLARGYVNRPSFTAVRFVANPFGANGSRLYRTGDIGRYRSDGTIEYLGRIDDQVKIRGNRVEPGEINARLMRHPAVRDSIVVPYVNSDGVTQLVAYVVPDPALPPASTTALRTFLTAQLPQYMVPASFITLERLPHTAHGKLDLAALPTPDKHRIVLDSAFAAPQTQLEKTIAGVWREVLHIEKAGANDNFFDLGGDSLTLIKTHEFLTRVVPRQFSVIDLFRHPTIRLLAEFLTGPSAGAAHLRTGMAPLRKDAL